MEKIQGMQKMRMLSSDFKNMSPLEKVRVLLSI